MSGERKREHDYTMDYRVTRVIEQHSGLSKECETVENAPTWIVAEKYPYDDEMHHRMGCIAKRMELKGMPAKVSRVLGMGAYGAVYVMSGVFTAKVAKPQYIKMGAEHLQDKKAAAMISYNLDVWEQSVRESRHEFAVGLLLNDVPTPNFVKTFAMLKMKTKPESKTKGMRDLPIIVQERAPGITLDKWIEVKSDRPLEQLTSIWMQIVYSLHLAWERYGGFAHNDLHMNNILVQELKEEIQIPYPLKSGTRYLRTNVLVKIIDYGMATIGQGEDTLGLYAGDSRFIWKKSDGVYYYPGGSELDTYLFDLSRMSFWEKTRNKYLQKIMGDIPRYLTHHPRDPEGKTYRDEKGNVDIFRLYLYKPEEIMEKMQEWDEDAYIQGMEHRNDLVSGAFLSMEPWEGITLGSCSPKMVEVARKKARVPTKCEGDI